MMDLMKLRADGSGGGQAVLNFVGLGAAGVDRTGHRLKKNELVAVQSQA